MEADVAFGMGTLQDSFAMSQKKEVSLKTLTKKQKKKIMTSYEKSRKDADDFYQSHIESTIIKRKKIYDAPKELYKEKFPQLSELTDWISRDVKTTIDWMLPALMDVFNGTDDPCDIQGVSLQDDAIAKKVQSIIKYQVNKKNNYFTFLYNYIREGLITNEGCAKVYWNRVEDRTEMEVMVDGSNLAMMVDLVQQGKAEIKNIEMIGDIAAIVTYDQIDVKFNAPVLENMPASELRFTPDGKTLQECKFVAHRKIVKGDYLKRKEQEGIFSNVDKAIEKAGDTQYTALDNYNNEWLENNHANLSDDDKASKEVELYEAYLDVDYNNDGVMEHLIVHAVENEPIAIQENTFGACPFFIFSPEMDPYTPFGEASYADTLEQLQDLKTALVRQIIIAVGKNNRPQRFINENSVDMDALIDGDEIIPVRNGSNPGEAVMISPHIPIDGSTMTLIQYTQNEIEAQSGSTRYNQGLDSSSLNKTASGINAIMGAADKRMRLIARIFAETAWLPIVKHIIKLDQTFLDPYQQFRINDTVVNIAPNELDIDFDFTVNTGEGAATKEAQLNYLIMIMQQLYPSLMQLGVVTEKSWYETSKDLLEKMGIRNIQNYLLDPDSQEYKQLQQQKAQQAQAVAQQQLQAQMAIQKAKLDAELQRQSIPRTNINYKDLPIEGKIQLIKEIFGIDLSMQSTVEKELLDADIIGGATNAQTNPGSYGQAEKRP